MGTIPNMIFLRMAGILLLISALAGCRKEKPVESAAEVVESPSEKTTSPIQSSDSESQNLPADGLFDDFIYVYMRSPDFQKDRTLFPLKTFTDGVEDSIGVENWTFNPLYVKEELYTLIYDSEESVGMENDSALAHVVVEWVYLRERTAKQFVFDKLAGLWKLTEINSHGFKRNPNGDFYSFYEQFATSSSFALDHIEDPFEFETYDEDNFEQIDGFLGVEQWQDFSPMLPYEKLININYGQDYGSTSQRVFMLCSPSGGMGCSLTFEKKGKSWTLTKLVN